MSLLQLAVDVWVSLQASYSVLWIWTYAKYYAILFIHDKGINAILKTIVCFSTNDAEAKRHSHFWDDLQSKFYLEKKKLKMDQRRKHKTIKFSENCLHDQGVIKKNLHFTSKPKPYKEKWQLNLTKILSKTVFKLKTRTDECLNLKEVIIRLLKIVTLIFLDTFKKSILNINA